MIADFWTTIQATDGLWMLLFGAALAGLVRGFSGFGNNIIYLPFAAQVIGPVEAIITLLIMDSIGPLPAVPRAVRDGDPIDVLRLVSGAAIGGVLGVALLVAMEPQMFRYGISVMGIGLVAVLILGLRYRGRVTTPMTVATGGLAGLLGGAVASPGPAVIFFYMARPLPVAMIRANILLFLFAFDLVLFVIFGVRGLFSWPPVYLGVLVLPIYSVALVCGTAIFNPKKERLYRAAAYLIILGAAISGLPFWDQVY